MNYWLKALQIGLVVFTTTITFASSNENEYLTWHKEHYDELIDSVQNCLEKLPSSLFLKEGPTTLYLAKDPHELRHADSFNITIIPGIITQEEKELFALFYVIQQLNPYSMISYLVYICDDAPSMPSMQLYLDVINHPFMEKKQLPKDSILHINTSNIDQEDKASNFL